jgi:hypothetical protein
MLDIILPWFLLDTAHTDVHNYVLLHSLTLFTIWNSDPLHCCYRMFTKKFSIMFVIYHLIHSKWCIKFSAEKVEDYMIPSVHTFQIALDVWPIRSPVIAVMNVGRGEQMMEIGNWNLGALFCYVHEHERVAISVHGLSKDFKVNLWREKNLDTMIQFQSQF